MMSLTESCNLGNRPYVEVERSKEPMVNSLTPKVCSLEAKAEKVVGNPFDSLRTSLRLR